MGLFSRRLSPIVIPLASSPNAVKCVKDPGPRFASATASILAVEFWKSVADALTFVCLSAMSGL